MDWVIKVFSFCMTLIFPLILFTFFTGDGHIKIFNYSWIAFYSCVCVCVVHKNKLLKASVCILNFCAVASVTLLFLMSDSNLIIKVIIKTVLPFIPIPQLH